MKKLSVFLCGTVLVTMTSAFAGTINVDINDPACVSGSGQPDPYTVFYCNIQDAIDDLDAAKATLRTEAKELSSSLSVITTRQDFSEKMINTLEDGVANLTNADMNEEGANMLMLQTRQALGTTSLSMASQAAQSVMRLF